MLPLSGRFSFTVDASSNTYFGIMREPLPLNSATGSCPFVSANSVCLDLSHRYGRCRWLWPLRFVRPPGLPAQQL